MAVVPLELRRSDRHVARDCGTVGASRRSMASASISPYIRRPGSRIGLGRGAKVVERRSALGFAVPCRWAAMHSPARPRAWRLTVVLTVVALLPVVLLTTASLVLSSRAVRHEVAQRVRTTADVSAVFVDQQTAGLSELIASYAERPGLVAALTRRGGIDHPAALVHLKSLLGNRPGITGAFLTDVGGTVTAVLPASPGVVGRNFAFRDWFKGVATTGGPYVSEAYQTALAGHPLVVAVADYVRSPDGRPLAVVAAIYSLDAIQGYADQVGVRRASRCR